AVRRAAPHSFGGFGLWLTAALEQLRAWTAAEAGPGRLVPWLPVAFGTGLALYFAAEREPALWASVTATVALAAATVLARRRPRGFAVAALATAVAAGFAL